MTDGLYKALTESRALALHHGDYVGTVREHENIIKIATKLSRTANGEECIKLEALVAQVKAELDLLQDLVAELSSLSRGDSGHGKEMEGRRAGEVAREDDPEVWPPPTAEPGGRMAAVEPTGQSNMPIWARPRDVDNQRRHPGGGAVVCRRLAPDAPKRAQPEAAQKLRNERDNSVPAGRKRCFSLFRE